MSTYPATLSLLLKPINFSNHSYVLMSTNDSKSEENEETPSMISFGFYFVLLLDIRLLKWTYSVCTYHKSISEMKGFHCHCKFRNTEVYVREKSFYYFFAHFHVFILFYIERPKLTKGFNFIVSICGNDALAKPAVIQSRFKASLECIILLTSKRFIELLLKGHRCNHKNNVIVLKMAKTNLFYS